ncbi:DUF29 domain-containing protein [Methylococcaceae bacterium WWC4]|nr:DUF29 domain-containing protein [Methylococcaceae bacterium WWC4]
MSYETDFYGWTIEQAAALRSGRFTQLDLDNLIEEIESMGRSEKRAVESRLAVLFLHLLKWRYQPERRGKSWKCSIDVQRSRFQKILKENPGLKSQLDGILADAYETARYEAFQETGIDIDAFPVACPWDWTQITDVSYYPE